MSETNSNAPTPNGGELLRGIRSFETFLRELEPISRSVNDGEIILEDRYEIHVFLHTDKDISRLRNVDGGLLDVYRERSFSANSIQIMWPDQHNPFKPTAMNLVRYDDDIGEYEVLCVEFDDIDHIDLVDTCNMPDVIMAKSIKYDILALREFYLAMSNISDGLEGETVITDDDAHFVIEFTEPVRADFLSMDKHIRASQIGSMAANSVVFPLDPGMGDVIEMRDNRNPENVIIVEVSFSSIKDIKAYKINIIGQNRTLP
jgi:hypothetical protein